MHARFAVSIAAVFVALALALGCGARTTPMGRDDGARDVDAEDDVVASGASIAAMDAAHGTASEAGIASADSTRRTQFVLVGMDTTPHWQRRGFEGLVRQLNRGRSATSPPSTFTLFIGSGGMQLDERRELDGVEAVFRGVPPRHNPVFDYAEDLAEIRGKAENIRRLASLGVEIGSHTVRHEHGAGFDDARWDFELDDHARILELVGLAQPVGFRAPFLETNEALYRSLARHGYRYDASRPERARRWPARDANGVWQFGIPSVAIPERERPVLFFDLSMERQLRAAAIARGIREPSAQLAWMDEAFFRAGLAAFERRYEGGRAPLLVSGHGGFRDAIARLMRRVCGLPDVRCATFSEAVAYLEAHPELEGAP